MKESAKISASLDYKGRDFRFSVEASGRTVDQGFDYEFWGACGRTHDYVFEVDEVTGGMVVVSTTLGEYEVPVEKFRARYPKVWDTFETMLFDGEGLDGYEVESEESAYDGWDEERY